MSRESQNTELQRIRMILKFDTGADGFLKMIYVLAGAAVIILFFGVYFLFFYYHGIAN